jgi:mono/diheme cytochrome c family protein
VQNKLFVIALVTVITLMSATAILGSQKTVVPVVPSTTVSGAEIYRANCASCHGAIGVGDGKYAAMLVTPPTNLTQLKRQHGGKFPSLHVLEILRNGPEHANTTMPVWADRLASGSASPAERALLEMRLVNLVRHVESLQQ